MQPITTAVLSALGLTAPGAASPPSVALLAAVPFLGLLLSFAVLPVAAPRWWHRRQGWVAAGWSMALLLPQGLILGPGPALAAAWQLVLGDYLPFITLILALYAAGGGVLVRGGCTGTPGSNVALLALGTLAAAVMGTIGAAMVLIHPLLRANAHRRRKLHLVVAFIVLVANAGGALSPLGPPLYLGFLHGVGFFWPLLRLGPAVALLAGVILAGVWLLDRRLARTEKPPPPPERFRLRGAGNLVLILLVAGTVFTEGLAHLGRLRIAGAVIPLAQFGAIGVFLAVAGLAGALTPRAIHQGNDFSWAPMREVAGFFLALFLTLAPVAALLRAGPAGPLGSLPGVAGARPGPQALFWLTGGLSAVLDNAPSYLLAWGLAGFGPAAPAAEGGRALVAISAGATLFGGLTYLGNAPNLVVRAIAAHRGVRMPGFLGYAAWATLMLLPVLVLLAMVWV